MRTIKLNQSIRRAAIVATAAVLLPFFVKALPAEKPSQLPAGKADTTGLAKANRTADSLLKADYPYLYAKCMEASGKGNDVAPAASKPAAGNEIAALPAEAREKDVKTAEVPAESGSNIGALYDQINKYGDLSNAEREKLGKDVAASNDDGLIGYYNEAKSKYAPAPAAADTSGQKQNVPAKKLEEKKGSKLAQKKAEKPKPAEKKIVEQKPVPIASNVKPVQAPPAAEKIDIGALYDQVNKYGDLTGTEREELGKKVAASGDDGLMKYFGETKAKLAPEPAKADSAKAKDSSGLVAKLSKRIEKRVETKTPAEKQDARRESLKKTEVELYKQGATNPEVLAAVSPARLAALKDSLNAAINACYDTINSMNKDNYAKTGARVGESVGKIGKIIRKSFPKGDPWAEYTISSLERYYQSACDSFAGRKE